MEIQLPLDDIRQVIADLTLWAEMMLDDLLFNQFGLSTLDYGNIRDRCLVRIWVIPSCPILTIREWFKQGMLSCIPY